MILLFFKNVLNYKKNISLEDQVKTFLENLLNSKPVEFYFVGINKLLISAIFKPETQGKDANTHGSLCVLRAKKIEIQKP